MKITTRDSTLISTAAVAAVALTNTNTNAKKGIKLEKLFSYYFAARCVSILLGFVDKTKRKRIHSHIKTEMDKNKSLKPYIISWFCFGMRSDSMKIMRIEEVWALVLLEICSHLQLPSKCMYVYSSYCTMKRAKFFGIR